MNEHVKLIAGCVVFIPVIAFLLLSAGELWRGKWLGLAAGGWTFAPDERPDSPYYKRRGKRIALTNLVFAIMFAGQLGLLFADQLGDAPAIGATWPFVAISICFVGCGTWVLLGSRRDGKAIAAAAAGTGPELAEKYEFGRRQIAVLVVIMLAVLAVEVASSLIASW